MKRYGIVGFIVLFVVLSAFVISTTSEAQNQEYRKQIGKKVERGVGNALFGWTELPKRIVDITKESNPIWGLIAGTYQGTLKGVARTASGLVDVATCGIKADEKSFVKPDMDVE